jgi:hypothetical protein
VKTRWIVIAFGVLIICIGGWIMIQPLGLEQFADIFFTSSGLWVAAGLRVVLGILLWMSAAASRMPRTLRVLGVLFIVGGLAIPVIGVERLQGIAEWGAALDRNALRFAALVAIGMGTFIVWSVWPQRSAR